MPRRVRPLGSQTFPVPRKCHKSGQGAQQAAARRRSRLSSRASSPRLPACPAHPLPPQTCPAAPPRPAPEPGAGDSPHQRTLRSFPPPLPRVFPARSPLPEAGAVGGSGGHRKLEERTRITWQLVPNPPSVPGRGRGMIEGRPGRKREPRRQREWAGGWRGRRRALTLARLRSQPGRARSLLLLLRLARRRRLGAVCSAQRSSRSPRNAHTLNRYIVDIRR